MPILPEGEVILELENSSVDQNIMTKKMMAGEKKAQTDKGKWTTQLQVPEELWSLSSSGFGKIKSATSIRITTDRASLAVQWLGCLTFTSGGDFDAWWGY